MKKFFAPVILCALFFFGVNQVKALTFEEAIKQPKPIALYLYADWADGAEQGLQIFDQMESQYQKKYNFVKLDIATPDTKAFNKIYHIYPNLPYVLLFRDGVKFSKYITKDCVNKESCFKNKLDSFAN